MLDTGYWLLEDRNFWSLSQIPDAGCWILDAGDLWAMDQMLDT
jgi:hypothetical protein